MLIRGSAGTLSNALLGHNDDTQKHKTFYDNYYLQEYKLNYWEKHE